MYVHAFIVWHMGKYFRWLVAENLTVSSILNKRAQRALERSPETEDF